METHKSMFGDQDDEEDFIEAAINTADQEAEQFLMLSDFDRTTKLFRAALTALGNDKNGAIATLNTLLKRSEILDQEAKNQIMPLIGELKALLLSSQEELKNFNREAQKSLEQQIRDVIGNIDFSPLDKKIAEANEKILTSANELSSKADEIQNTAETVHRLSRFQTLKWLLAGCIVATVLMYGFFELQQRNYKEKLQAQYDEKWSALEERFKVLKTQNPEHWNILKMNDNGREYLQFVIRDTSSQASSGKGFTTDANGKKYQVSYFNIPIFK